MERKEAWTTAVATVRTMDELNFYIGRASDEGVPLLLQFGNKACVKCPEFTDAVTALKKQFHFFHAYCDTYEADDLLEEYNVTKVPSILIAKKHIKTAFLNTDVETLTRVVKENCSPVLSLDEDF